MRREQQWRGRKLLWHGPGCGGYSWPWRPPGSPGLPHAVRARGDEAAAGCELVCGACRIWTRVPGGLCPDHTHAYQCGLWWARRTRWLVWQCRLLQLLRTGGWESLPWDEACLGLSAEAVTCISEALGSTLAPGASCFWEKTKWDVSL